MVISGKELSAKLKAEMAAEVAAFGAKYGRVPHLVVILVAEARANALKDVAQIGCDNLFYRTDIGHWAFEK